MGQLRFYRGGLAVAVLMIATLLASCISPGTPWSDHLGGVRYMSFGNTSEHEIVVGTNNFVSANRIHAQWQTNDPEESEPLINHFSFNIDEDGVLTATMNNGIGSWSVSRSGFDAFVALFGEEPPMGIANFQMHVRAESGTLVEITGLGLGTTPEPYAAEDGSDVWYDITIPFGEGGFGLSGNIILYGDFGESAADDSMVEFLFDGEGDEPSRPSGKLTVTVVKTDGNDVSGIPVTFGGDLGATLHTNASGAVTVSGLRAGTYTVNTSASGYTSNGPKDIVLDSDSDEGSATITLTPVPPPPAPPGPGAVHGKVMKGDTGDALPGALVKLRDENNDVISMAVAMLEGEFAFDGLEPGSYSVTATLDGYDPAVELAEVANDATTIVVAVLSGAVVIVEPPAPPAQPPDLPTTGASYLGIMFLGIAAVAVGYGVRRGN